MGRRWLWSLCCVVAGVAWMSVNDDSLLHFVCALVRLKERVQKCHSCERLRCVKGREVGDTVFASSIGGAFLNILKIVLIKGNAIIYLLYADVFQTFTLFPFIALTSPHILPSKVIATVIRRGIIIINIALCCGESSY